MNHTYRMVKLSYGDRWPKYAWYDSWKYRGDIEIYLRESCLQEGGAYYNNPALFKEHKIIDSLEGDPVDGEYAAIILEEEPERNEFGVVSP